MILNYTFFYIEANIVCIIIFAMLLMRSLGNVDRQEKQRVFDSIVISHIMYFISDILWVLILANKIPHTRLTASIVNISNAVLLCCITCFWFIHEEMTCGEKYVYKDRNRAIISLPVLLELIIMLILFPFFPQAVLDKLNNPTTLYYVLLIFIPALYIIISAVRAFGKAVRKENYAVRSQYVAFVIYPIIVSVFGTLQTQWLRAPLFCFGSTITMIYVYIVSLDNQVSIDALTNLNNRTQLKRYIANESSRLGSDRITHYVIMIDLNKFKSINDKYGHVEGDFALQRAADALKASCTDNTIRPFIARYGGDEFIIIARTDDEERIKQLCTRIRKTMIQFNKDAGSPYELTASIGYSVYNGDVKDFQDALNRADEALYKDKAKTKT